MVIQQQLFTLIAVIVLANISASAFPRVFADEEGSRNITINATDYQTDLLNMSVTITDLNTKTVVFKGYTPVDFSALPNDKYQVSIAGGYGTRFYFDHWSDLMNYQADTLGPAGSAPGPVLRAEGVPFRYVPADGKSYDLESVYRTEAISIGMTPLGVDAVDQNGKELSGMYIVIYACDNAQSFITSGMNPAGCEVVSSGWTPYPTGIFPEFPYYVSAISWHSGNVSDSSKPKAYLFDHWENGARGLISAGSPATTLVAVYGVVN